MRTHQFTRLASAIGGGYVGGLVVWFAVWWVWGDANWLLIALNRYALYLLGPALLLPGLVIIDRRWAVGLLLPAGIAVNVYGHTLFPAQPGPPPQTPLRVLSFNVLFSNNDHAQVSALILRARPDLVALQEVTPAMYARLRTALGDAYGWSELSGVHPYGSPAIFSRHPVRRYEVLDLQADRTALAAEVVFEGQTMTFVSAHLLAYGLRWSPVWEWPRMAELRTFEQRRQAELLAEAVRTYPGAVVLGCDCNAQITNDSYRVLAGVLAEAARPAIGAAGGLAGLPSGIERRLDRIDYQFYGGGLQVLGAYTLWEQAGSDHYPVLVDYALAR